jgi:L-asparaginase/Glu-tRNA(Gln) amidotransferase subunit D
MRFLRLAVNEGRGIVLTGSQRMTERPIKFYGSIRATKKYPMRKKWVIRSSNQRTKITASKVNIPQM